MLIVHGTYQFSAKRVAFRNDFCANCRLPCRATQLRTFDVHHIFWIPLIPMGFHKRWYCADAAASLMCTPAPADPSNGSAYSC